MPTAATEVGHVGAGAQPLGQAVDQRQHDVDQRGVEHRAALSRPSARGSVGYSLYGSPPPSRKQPMIFCSTSPSSGMNSATRARLSGPAARVSTAGAMGGQRVGGGVRVVVDDVPGGHAGQPLPDVALVESGGIGDLRAGGRRSPAMVSSRPVWWPMLSRMARLAPSMAAVIRSVNSSVVSKAVTPRDATPDNRPVGCQRCMGGQPAERCMAAVSRLEPMSQTVRGVISRRRATRRVGRHRHPRPGPGEVVVDIIACGVCHTDLTYREGGINDEYPFLLGHEAAGTVEAVGPGVTAVAPGDFVDPELARGVRAVPGLQARPPAAVLRHLQRHAEDDADRRHRAHARAGHRGVRRQDAGAPRASAPRSIPRPTPRSPACWAAA